MAANIPTFMIFETFEDYDVPWRAELTSRFPALRDRYYDVPTAPGWGIEGNALAASAHPYDPDAKLDMFAAEWEEKMCR